MPSDPAALADYSASWSAERDPSWCAKETDVRVAYLLMVHRRPEQVRALLNALPADSPVFVHVDARVRSEVYRSIAALRSERHFVLVRRHRCYWGRIGMVKATLELVGAALDSGEDWQFASLLSGADYPIKSTQEISAYLDARRGRQFMSMWDMRSDNPWTSAPGRLQSESRVDRRHIGAGRRILRSPWKRRMPYGLHPFGGSQWWTLSFDALVYVREFVRNNPRYLPFMRGVFIPDECFFQTILANSPLKSSIEEDDLRYVDWGRPTPPHPAVLGTSDIDALAESPKLYARKFDIDFDAEVFQEIDRRLLRSPG